MLKYFIIGTESLLVAGIILGMLYAYSFERYGSLGRRILAWGSLAGFLAACVLAYMKNKTRLVNTGTLNMYFFSVSLIAFVLFVLLDMGWFRRRAGKPGEVIVSLMMTVIGGLQILYVLPDVLSYPYTIVLGGEEVFSTGFLYRIIGLILGVGLVILVGLSAHNVLRKIKVGAAGILTKLALLVVALRQVYKILQTLLSRRIISGHTLFQIVKFCANHDSWFSVAVVVTVVFLPLILWIRSFKVREPYENPAEHRKIRAKWRSVRRWSAALLVTLICSVITITSVKAYANRPVELSAVEECELRGDSLYIPFSQVEDGHLHRFAYTTDNNVAVRFIIIKKPNSSAYGIGLDACDICGETGYYERKGQVVCNRCDVVMNINTIGFKGGCNPKIIDYSIENGYIIVPTSTLIEHESDFK